MIARSRNSRPNNRGASLLELLVYVVAFGMAVNLMISLLGTGSRLAATTTLSLGRMDGIREVQTAFTKHVRQAAAVADRAGDFETTERRLVLRMPPGQTAGFDYVVLGELHQPDRFGILRLANTPDGLEQVYLKTLRQPLGTLRFETETGSARPVVHLDVQVKQQDGERERPFLVHRATAVPRGIGQ